MRKSSNNHNKEKEKMMTYYCINYIFTCIMSCYKNHCKNIKALKIETDSHGKI